MLVCRVLGDDVVRELERLLDDLELERAHLVGHSMGSMIALNFALEKPERVNRLMALCGVFDRNAEHRARSRRVAELLASEGPGATRKAVLERWFCDDDFRDPARAERVANILSILDQADATGYARAYRCFVDYSDAAVGRINTLQARALFLTAEHDPNSTPAMSRRMAELSPRGKAMVVANERHMLPAMAPEKINPRMIEFLRTNWSQ